MAKYYMGIDIGTFESKGTLVDENAKIIAYHACPHEMEVPHPGYAEHDAEKVWWGDLCTISNALIALLPARRQGSQSPAQGYSLRYRLPRR